MQGNLGNDGDPLVPRAALVAAATFAGHGASITRSISGTSKHPSAEPLRRVPDVNSLAIMTP